MVIASIIIFSWTLLKSVAIFSGYGPVLRMKNKISSKLMLNLFIFCQVYG